MPGTQSSVERSRHHGKIEDLSSSARTLWHTICLIVWLARTQTMSIWCPRPDRRRQAFAEILSLYSRLSAITSEVSEYLTTSKEDAVPSTVWHRYNTEASASLSPSLPRNMCLEPVLSFPSFSNFASGIQTVYVSFDHWINQARTVLSFLKQKYRLLLARLILASAVIGDFQGCLRVGKQRQVNGGQQNSSAGWLDCSTRRHALQKKSVWDWHFCARAQCTWLVHVTCRTRRHVLQKTSATSHIHYIGMHKNSSTIVPDCYDL